MKLGPGFFYGCRVTEAAATDPPCGYEQRAEDRFCTGCARGGPVAEPVSEQVEAVQKSWAERWSQ